MTLTPYASEYEGYMGNYGNTMDRWYRRAALVVWPQAAHRSVSGPNHLGSALGHIRAVGAQPGCPCHHDPRPEHSISTAKAPAKEEIRRGRSRQHRHLNAMDEDGGREASLGDEEMAMP